MYAAGHSQAGAGTKAYRPGSHLLQGILLPIHFPSLQATDICDQATSTVPCAYSIEYGKGYKVCMMIHVSLMCFRLSHSQDA